MNKQEFLCELTEELLRLAPKLGDDTTFVFKSVRFRDKIFKPEVAIRNLEDENDLFSCIRLDNIYLEYMNGRGVEELAQYVVRELLESRIDLNLEAVDLVEKGRTDLLIEQIYLLPVDDYEVGDYPKVVIIGDIKYAYFVDTSQAGNLSVFTKVNSLCKLDWETMYVCACYNSYLTFQARFRTLESLDDYSVEEEYSTLEHILLEFEYLSKGEMAILQFKPKSYSTVVLANNLALSAVAEVIQDDFALIPLIDGNILIFVIDEDVLEGLKDNLLDELYNIVKQEECEGLLTSRRIFYYNQSQGVIKAL